MSSTNKTENLRLNSWIGSDKPMRTDFNYDNEVLDSVITEHNNDKSIHITQEERSLWNSYIYMGMYFGNGDYERSVQTECPFDISFGIVFANNRPVSITRFNESGNYNYVAFIGKQANSLGAALVDGNINIVQSPSSEMVNEYMNLNETGVAYNYILFR